jgi:hypothetical protein
MRDARGRHLCPDGGLVVLFVLAVLVLAPGAAAVIGYGAVGMLWLLDAPVELFPFAAMAMIACAGLLLGALRASRR